MGGKGGGGGESTRWPMCKLEMVNEALLRSHTLQLGPSSHDRSGELHSDATSASLPIAALVAAIAAGGMPLP